MNGSPSLESAVIITEPVQPSRHNRSRPKQGEHDLSGSRTYTAVMACEDQEEWMAKVKDHLAQVGMGAVVAGLKAVEKSISKKQYKRLIATAVAQLLTMHPDYRGRQSASPGAQGRRRQSRRRRC